MFVLMVWVEMAVRMRVAGAIRMLMFVLVEHDLQAMAEGIGDAAQGPEARNMITAFEARDHRFRHREPLRELSLRLARASAQLEQAPGALRRDRDAVIGQVLRRADRAGLLHGRPSQICEVHLRTIAKLGQSALCSPASQVQNEQPQALPSLSRLVRFRRSAQRSLRNSFTPT